MSNEVQVFDGDGEVPPDIKKIVAENESLREQVQWLKNSVSVAEHVIDSLKDEVKFYEEKFWKISKLTAVSYKEHRDKIEEVESIKRNIENGSPASQFFSEVDPTDLEENWQDHRLR